jgi:3-hexulose-6-phosphate synthase
MAPAKTTSSFHEPRVQISLDLTSIDEALHVAEIALATGVDWLEAGTPLILAEGLRGVRALHERFPAIPIVADLKTMDGGYLEVEMMAQAGASWCVVMGVAHPATITACVTAARQYGIGIMGDILAALDKVGTARLLQDLGVDVIIVHTGFDERRAVVGVSPWDDLAAVAAAVDLPIQAVGGATPGRSAPSAGGRRAPRPSSSWARPWSSTRKRSAPANPTTTAWRASSARWWQR